MGPRGTIRGVAKEKAPGSGDHPGPFSYCVCRGALPTGHSTRGGVNARLSPAGATATTPRSPRASRRLKRSVIVLLEFNDHAEQMDNAELHNVRLGYVVAIVFASDRLVCFHITPNCVLDSVASEVSHVVQVRDRCFEVPRNASACRRSRVDPMP